MESERLDRRASLAEVRATAESRASRRWIANESQPSETVAELARADQVLKESFGLITLPLLILHGTADKVTKPSGSQEFYEKAGSGDKTLKLYEGHFHDLLADVGKQQVMADIQRWIDAPLEMVAHSRRERPNAATASSQVRQPTRGAAGRFPTLVDSLLRATWLDPACPHK